MIRVTCPTCQHPHEFLEFYRGLTIYCKKCKAGILVPRDAESAPEGAAPPPAVETPRVPAPDTNHAEVAPPIAEAPLNHQVKPEVEPLPPEPLPDVAPPAPRADEFDDEDERPNNKRVLILAGILLVILLGGVALVVRSYMKGGGSPIVQVDPNKKDNINPEPKPEPPAKKTPEPKSVDGPNGDKEKTKEPATKKPEVAIVSWYTTDELPYIPPSTSRYIIDEDDLIAGRVFLVVKVRLPGKLLDAVKEDDKWSFELDTKHFLIQDDKENEGNAAGLESNGGFMELVGKEPTPKAKLIVHTDTEPSHHDAGMYFSKIPFKTANENQLQLQYRDLPPVKLDALTRIKAPERPKKIETPKKVEPEPKNEDKKDVPKKIEIAKKPDVPVPPEKKTPKLTADPNIEIIEWIVSDTLASADPDKKLMTLSSSDRLDRNVFLAVKVKLLSKAFTAVKGEVRWTVRLNAKDFSIEGDGPAPFIGRGLEYDGNYGSTTATGYLPWADQNILFEEEPDSLVQGVFFTVPRKLIDSGGLVLFYRDSAPVKLEEGKRKK